MSHSPIVSPDPERLAEFIFELASQLHVERTHRIALELALERAGVLKPNAGEALAKDAELRVRSLSGLDQSMAKLMRIIAQSADERAPMRTAGVAPVRGDH